MNTFLKEIASLWDKMNDLSKRLSEFTQMLNAQRKNEIAENSEAVIEAVKVVSENNECNVDLTYGISENSESIVEILSMIEELTERLNNLENGGN